MVSVTVATDMSTEATEVPDELKIWILPEVPSVGAPENVMRSGGSGQMFWPPGGGKSALTPAGRLPCDPAAPLVPAVPLVPATPLVPAAPVPALPPPPAPLVPAVPPLPLVPAAPLVPATPLVPAVPVVPPRP